MEIKTWTIQKKMALMAALFVPTSLVAKTILQQRCAEDSLTVEQAEGRIDWAIECKHLPAAQRHHLMHFHDFDELKGRPLYPTWAMPDGSNPHNFKAPFQKNAPCMEIPANYELHGFCTSSCYTPEQRILFSEGYKPILHAKEQKLETVIGLDESSSMGDIRLKSLQVRSYVEEIRETNMEIIIFLTADGGELKVTDNHPLVDGNGEMREAKTFDVGDKLVRVTGETVAITNIKTINYFGKVYNLDPKSEGIEENLLVAEGFITGSARYQAIDLQDLNRAVLRSNIPSELL